MLLSYEEAIGFCVGDVVPDKDGVCAAAVFVEMTTFLRDTLGRSAVEQFEHLSSVYGTFVSYNSYVFSYDCKVTDAVFHRLRCGGPAGAYWETCAGSAIVAIQDITMGYDSTKADKKSEMPATPESHMIMFEFANGCTVTLRTSGTEPKIKFYTEIAGEPGAARGDIELRLKAFVNGVVDEMLQPEANGLKRV